MRIVFSGLMVLMFASGVSIAQTPPAKPRVFLVPARAKVYEQKAEVEGNSETVWVKAGGVVTAKVNVGLFFVERGGVLQVNGNVVRIVVADGGTLTSVDGNVVHVHHAKAARIGPIQASADHVTVHAGVALRRADPFELSGTVRGTNGTPARDVRVHAFTLGQEPLAQTRTDAEGSFAFKTDEEVSSLAADVSPAWAHEKHLNDSSLERRQRLSKLEGWQAVVVHGPWTDQAVVDFPRPAACKLKLKESLSLRGERQGYPGFRFSQDGSLLMVLWPDDGTKKGKAEVQLWNVATGKQLGQFPLKAAPIMVSAEEAAISPDAKLLAVIGPDGLEFHPLSPGVQAPKLPETGGDFQCLTFSPDGKMLAAGSKTGIHVWDVTRGVVLKRLKGHPIGTTRLAFAPDSKALLSGGQRIIQDDMITAHTSDRLRLWSLATGAEIGQPFSQEGQLTFSASGLVMSAGEADRIVRNGNSITFTKEEFISVANPTSGRERLRLQGKGGMAAFSRDGRLIITVGGQERTIRFIEVLTGEDALAVPVPDSWIPTFGLSPDGQTLATSRQDGVVRIWNLGWDRLRMPPPASAFTAADTERFWKALAGDAAGAYDVVWQLSRAPEQAVRFLSERLQPAAVRELPMQKLLKELDSPNFATRDTASRELSKLGHAAERAIRTALQAKQSLELQRRLEAILADLEQQPATVEELRQARAIAALEWSGTPAARKLLTTLAAGWADARQTQEAAAALERLVSPKR